MTKKPESDQLSICILSCSAYESIAAAFVRLSVGDDDRFVDIAELLEVLAQTVVSGVVRQTSHEDLR